MYKRQDVKQYEIIQERELRDIKSKGYLLKHKKSGARVVLLENKDDNKVFSIGFRTPPEDSTGLPHILEHSVLCGSKNFPVKDPDVYKRQELRLCVCGSDRYGRGLQSDCEGDYGG